MAFLSWNDKLSVGHEALDAQHRVLINLINRLDDMINMNVPTADFGMILDELLLYVVGHFDYEEQLLAITGYPDFDAHIEEHMAMRTKIAAFCQRFHHDDSLAIREETLSFLQDWFSHHVMVSDAAFKPHLLALEKMAV